MYEYQTSIKCALLCAFTAFNQHRTLSGHRHSQISALVSSSLSGCSSICESNDVCVKDPISKSAEVLLQLVVGITEQQTSHLSGVALALGNEFPWCHPPQRFTEGGWQFMSVTHLMNTYIMDAHLTFVAQSRSIHVQYVDVRIYRGAHLESY